MEPIRAPSTVTIAPYGEVEIMTIRAPEGAWLEFYQQPAEDDVPVVEE